MLLHRQFFSLGWGGGRWEGERGGEPKRAGTGVCRAGLDYPPAPAAVGNPPHLTHTPSPLSAFCLGLLSQKIRVQDSPPCTSLPPLLAQFQQTALVRGVHFTTTHSISPPSAPKPRYVPLRNWGSEFETTFSPSDLSRPHRNKGRYTPFPNFVLQILGIFGGSLKKETSRIWGEREL